MNRQIVVGVDGSQSAERLLGWAAESAVRNEARLDDPASADQP
jgi:nucleotide-binding universal stress UspA family protein